ncbi:glutamine ABC transporter substrate-binding protein GlnH [Desulfofustis limnaeus]|jgi:glutamine transport system substrate-binding protein|uniref:Amino acid ABC transporter substrate-binding protein n=1 Tax=Desulfofustis limnaeus TaxID=2740163 RepID=A0ABN6MA58_9BACT|nr:glutamine ABC transporter substrate-binding protein GlnH [Desulfofustis limnaeus]MDX9896350.1 glutamine ABC transporter substrate-binding protein GlnH [Desulfofustis sp.]BDD88438.1 amino acid ABC transporter substrate-binding protein [Desulfofustis limnaeus]
MKKLLTIVLTAALALSLTAMAQAKKIIVGHDTNFMPFEFKDPDSGKYVGFDIDMWTLIAESLGIEYELQPMDFNGLIPALQSGNIDAAIAGMTIKSEREKVVDFAYPYYDAGLMILVRSDNEDIKNLEDLEGKVVATKLGTTSEDFVKKNAKAKDVSLFPNIDGAYMELATGGAEAVLFDSPAVMYYAQTAGKGKAKVVGPLYMGQSYGIAFPAGSELREKVTIEILNLMESGKYAELYKKWFGTEPK